MFPVEKKIYGHGDGFALQAQHVQPARGTHLGVQV